MVEPIHMLKTILDELVSGRDLAPEQAYGALNVIMSGNATDAQIGGFLIALRMKGETAEEIGGFARAMRDNAVPIRTSRKNVIDTCGTGGDRVDTFNISTAAALVAAGAGVAIAKHGNRAVSSRCGSADVLKAVGVNIEASPEVVSHCLDEIGIGFLFAPTLHPAMRYAIGPRRELGLRTVFNVLGPLTNPAGARRQLIGVFAPQYTELLAEALLTLGSEHALVVHGLVGMDEISTVGETQVSELRDGAVTTQTWTPEQFGIERAELDQISGGDPQTCAALLMAVLEGEKGPRRDIVLLNAAAAIYIGGLARSMEEGLEKAAASLDSGAARTKLEALKTLSR
ncbi:anthranilate phosphoribosyltransferase [bacterium]|nr:anthranilate phosphoribosyltransferase [bacterium]